MSVIKKFLFCLTGIALMAGFAVAQVDFDILLTEADSVPVTGSSSGGEFDGVVVDSTGNTMVVYDSEGDVDSLLSITGGVVTIIANEATICALGANCGGSPSVSGGDLVIDSNDNVYFLWFDGTDSNIAKWPLGNFGAAVLMNAVGTTNNVLAMAVDEVNSRLLFPYNNVFGAVTESISAIPLSASNATPSVIATEANLLTALQTGVDGSDELDMNDITVQSDGSIIVSNGYSNDTAGGTLLKSTAGGVVTLFALPTALTAVSAGTTDIGNVHLVALSDDRIVALCPFTNAGDSFIALGTADGTGWSLIATETTIAADAEVIAANMAATQLRIDGHGVFALPDDTILWSTQNFNDTAIIEMTGFLAVENWNKY